MRRRVDVTFSKIKMIDDSDDLSHGDFMFGFFINGANAPNGTPMTFGGHIGSGTTVTAGVSGSVTGAPATLTLRSIGYDDDETEWIPVGPFVAILLNTCGTGDVSNPATPSEGQDSCGEWTSATASFNLTALGENAANIEDHTHSFTLQARPKGDDSEVKYDVTGTFRVRFVP